MNRLSSSVLSSLKTRRVPRSSAALPLCTCSTSTSWSSIRLLSTASSGPASTSTSIPSAASQLAQQSYARNRRPRNTALPQIKDQRLIYLGAAAFSITAWTFFVMWAMSAEKAASTVVRTLAFNLRSSPIVKDALGEEIKLKPFLLGTEPWINGKVNTIQGVVDINFRVQAANGREGTVYFKSERRHKAGRFETVEFKLLVDGDPRPIELMNTDLLQLGN